MQAAGASEMLCPCDQNVSPCPPAVAPRRGCPTPEATTMHAKAKRAGLGRPVHSVTSMLRARGAAGGPAHSARRGGRAWLSGRRGVGRPIFLLGTARAALGTAWNGGGPSPLVIPRAGSVPTDPQRGCGRQGAAARRQGSHCRADHGPGLAPLPPRVPGSKEVLVSSIKCGAEACMRIKGGASHWIGLGGGRVVGAGARTHDAAGLQAGGGGGGGRGGRGSRAPVLLPQTARGTR